MYKKIIFTALLGSAALANSVHAGRGSGSPNDPTIDATLVDAKQSVLIIQGDHFGTTTPSVFLGKWQLKLKESSDENVSSAPFFTTIFVADRE